ncbi:MAG: transposase [Thermodesulfobacteriota bacterium]|nr:transposase [Thermodesulfobacteriota bacterium]
MNEITTILNCLHPLLDTTTYRQLQVISQTLLMMTGRITMLGISRWAEGKGGSYLTIQRFFTKDIPWSSLNWAVAKVFLKRHAGVILIAGDATTAQRSPRQARRPLVLADFFLPFTHVQFRGLPFKPCHCWMSRSDHHGQCW